MTRYLVLKLCSVEIDGLEGSDSTISKVIGFLQKYAELKKIPDPPAGIIETCVDKWLSDMENDQHFYQRLVNDLSRKTSEETKCQN